MFFRLETHLYLQAVSDAISLGSGTASLVIKADGGVTIATVDLPQPEMPTLGVFPSSLVSNPAVGAGNPKFVDVLSRDGVYVGRFSCSLNPENADSLYTSGSASVGQTLRVDGLRITYGGKYPEPQAARCYGAVIVMT